MWRQAPVLVDTWAESVYDPDKWHEELRQLLASLMLPTILQGALLEIKVHKDVADYRAGKALEDEFDIDFDFDPAIPAHTLDQIKNDIFENYLAAPFWTQVSQTGFEETQGYIMDGIEQGLSINQIERNIRQGVTGNSAVRANRIARTEVNYGLNAGHQRVMEEQEREGLTTGKEWFSVCGNTTRETHCNLSGTVVNVNAHFDLDGNSTPYPSHWQLPAHHRINCQCTHMSQSILDNLGDEFTDEELLEALGEVPAGEHTPVGTDLGTEDTRGSATWDKTNRATATQVDQHWDSLNFSEMDAEKHEEAFMHWHENVWDADKQVKSWINEGEFYKHADDMADEMLVRLDGMLKSDDIGKVHKRRLQDQLDMMTDPTTPYNKIDLFNDLAQHPETRANEILFPNGDPRQDLLARVQGYNAKPQRVGHDVMDSMVDQDPMQEFFRGMKKRDGAHQYINDDVPYKGYGVYGNGQYAACHGDLSHLRYKESLGMDSDEAIDEFVQKMYASKNRNIQSTAGIAGEYAEIYDSRGLGGSAIRGCMKPDARGIDNAYMDAIRTKHRMRIKEAIKNQNVRGSYDKLLASMQDNHGHIAMGLGFDFIRCHNTGQRDYWISYQTQKDSYSWMNLLPAAEREAWEQSLYAGTDYVVILNRGSTSVEKAPLWYEDDDYNLHTDWLEPEWRETEVSGNPQWILKLHGSQTQGTNMKNTDTTQSPAARRAAKQVAMSKELAQYTSLPAWEKMLEDKTIGKFMKSVVSAQYVYDDMPKKTQKVIDLLREQFRVYRPDVYAEQQED